MGAPAGLPELVGLFGPRSGTAIRIADRLQSQEGCHAGDSRGAPNAEKLQKHSESM